MLFMVSPVKRQARRRRRRSSSSSSGRFLLSSFLLLSSWCLQLIQQVSSLAARPRNPRRGPVEQVDLDTGEVIATFASASQAARAIGLTNEASIHRVVDGKLGSTKGFFWRNVGSNASPSPRAGYHGRKRPLEQVDLDTGRVIATFPSALQAARAFGKRSPYGILQVANGKQLRSNGYFWRDVGSCTLPSFETSGSGGERPVEQVDLKTGQVIARFWSISQAARANGMKSRTDIHRVVNGKQGSSNGYFWRDVGSSNLPTSRTKSYVRERPVEQVDLKTGQVIATFLSASQAARDNGLKSGTNIRRVVQGKQRSSNGYFWRDVGSNALPSPKAKGRHQKIPMEQVCLETGEVVATFDSICSAEKTLRLDGSGISRVVNGKQNSFGGYFFRLVGSTASPSDKARMRRQNHHLATSRTTPISNTE